jgi:lysophospholipase L1-like esterase
MSKSIRMLVAFGDCNTVGIAECRGDAYPELVARALSCPVRNLGHTMSTTRELLQYAQAYPVKDDDLVIIQYGLVDSWLTFKHAPYVLYYPDNPLRHVLRKIVKKLKKIGRTLHLKTLLGPAHVVPLDEYRRNIEHVIAQAGSSTVILLGTAPNLDEPRNPHILSFNQELERVAAQYPNVIYVDTYKRIYDAKNEVFYPDGTHLNAAGQRIVADMILQALDTR